MSQGAILTCAVSHKGWNCAGVSMGQGHGVGTSCPNGLVQISARYKAGAGLSKPHGPNWSQAPPPLLSPGWSISIIRWRLEGFRDKPTSDASWRAGISLSGLGHLLHGYLLAIMIESLYCHTPTVVCFVQHLCCARPKGNREKEPISCLLCLWYTNYWHLWRKVITSDELRVTYSSYSEPIVP